MRTLTIAAALGLLSPAVWGQRPQFEVASLKSNNGCENAPRKPGPFSPSPGRLEMACVDLQNLVQAAFGTFGDGVSINTEPLHIEGGPPWMQSEHYALSAKAEGPARTELLAGPMLQALLEERFRLKTHRETREAPVYAMTVAKGGLKVPALAEGACVPLDLSHPPAPPAPGEPPSLPCGVLLLGSTAKGEMMMEVHGATMTQLAQRLSGRLDHGVVDQTGVAGKFNFHVEFAPDSHIAGQAPPGGRGGDAGNPAAASDAGPDLFVALQEQLGLKLSPAKGPVSYLIIDHVEKPTAN